MPPKTPGKLNAPPPQEEFDRLPLAKWCVAIQGIYYPSRHDGERCNLAIFKRRHWLPEQHDAGLKGAASLHASRVIHPAGPLVLGPAVLLRDHPELTAALTELEVAVLP